MSTNTNYAQEQNLNTILALEKAAQFTPWSEKMFLDSLKAGHKLLALSENEEIIGFIVFTINTEESEILNLVIKPARQRKGYGRILLSDALSKIEKAGVKKIFLEVRQSNLAAQNLYLSLGFKKIGERKNYYRCDSGFENALLFGYFYDL
jgi:[ribosomal protein S18]-alanine N-acetyltransferase